MPQLVALTKALFQVICSNPHKGVEAPNVLDYPPPSRGPVLPFPASKALRQKPDYGLTPQLYLRSFAHTHTEI